MSYQIEAVSFPNILLVKRGHAILKVADQHDLFYFLYFLLGKSQKSYLSFLGLQSWDMLLFLTITKPLLQQTDDTVMFNMTLCLNKSRIVNSVKEEVFIMELIVLLILSLMFNKFAKDIF